MIKFRSGEKKELENVGKKENESNMSINLILDRREIDKRY